MPKLRLLRSLNKRVAKIRYHEFEVIKARFNRGIGKEEPYQLHQGGRHHPDGVYAIFLMWQPNETPWYVDNALASLDEAGANVVLVVNHELHAERLTDLKQRCSMLIVRGNAGFDIGGYRDATLHLLENAEPVRLIYLNDSVYFFRKGLTSLFHELASAKADVVGAFENREHGYHIQSFCFSVGQGVITSPEFATFWKRYLPVNSRLWAIRKGELGFSAAILPVARSATTVYTADKLRHRLTEIDSGDVAAMNGQLCRDLRLPAESFNGASRDEMVANICRRIAMRSQIHTAGFLYKKHLACPLMKRDLVYRMQFDIGEIEQNLIDVGHEGHLGDILADMTRKGSGDQLRSTKRQLFDQGII